MCVCVVNYFLYLNLLQPDQEIDCLSDCVCLDSEGVVPDGENYDTLMISSGIHIHTSSEDVIKNGPSCIESSHLWKPLSCAFFLSGRQ